MKKVTRFVQVLILFTALLFSTSVWAQTTLLSEGFTTGVIPTGWTQVIQSGSTNWTFNSVGGAFGHPATTHSGPYNALLYASGKGHKTFLITPAINFGTAPVGFLKFWHTQANWGDQDSLTVLYRTSATGAWKKLAMYTADYSTWTQETITLPELNGTYQIGFRGDAEYGYGVCLDDILVQAMTPPGPALVTIGTGTNTTGTYPYNTYWMGNRTQMLYTAAELLAGGASAGNITTFGLDISSYSTQTMTQFKIEMKNTTATSLTDFDNADWTTVYSTDLAVTATGWQNITLATPFPWDGTSNIKIHICYGSNGSYTSSTYVRYTTTPFTSVVYRYADNTTGCTMTAPSTSTSRPNVRLNVVPETGLVRGVVKNCYTGLPLAGASVTCPGATPTGSPATPYITGPDGAYIFFVPIGNKNITASATGFVTQVKPAAVPLNGTVVVDFCLDPVPGILTGTVTNCANGAPLNGVKVVYGTTAPNKWTAYTNSAGVYTMNVYPGTAAGLPLVGSKAGFGDYQSGTNLVGAVTPPGTTTYNFCLGEGLNAPSPPFTATLNAAQTAVNLSWGLPSGQYMLIYDDGVPENFAIWSTGGNMNAVKFTPVGYPAYVMGGRVNVGQASNYPSGSNPFHDFHMAIYDATGPGGTPGTMVPGTDLTISPTANVYGFLDFTYTTGVPITSGSFYLVMTQGGNAPNALGIAVDTTASQLRSYSKFGSTPWIPASGNYMIQAKMQGPGGPLLSDGMNITASPVPNMIYASKPSTHTGIEGVGRIETGNGDSPESITGYQVWRLLQGQTGTPALWTTIGTPTVTNMVDPAWPSLPCGPYMWAVKAQYTGNLWSAPTFSNVLGKCWTAVVTVNTDLSCDSTTLAHTWVYLEMVGAPDSSYAMETDATGTAVFDHVWKGTYKVTLKHFGYTDLVLYTNLLIMGDMTLNGTLLQIKTPPTDLTVNDRTLFSSWKKPNFSVPIFTENWSSGSFTTNAWVVAGTGNGINWQMSSGFGNPAPSVMFNYSPVQSTPYSETLTSKTLVGVNSPSLRLNYDYYLDNYGTTTLNQLAVEVWDGTTWHLVTNYQNLADYPWTSESFNIAQWTTGPSFKIRFRAYGENSNDINNWNIDNISVVATGPEGVDPCLIGYNYMLNGAVVAFVPPDHVLENGDPYFQIPRSAVTYGTVYNACVNAIYGSGYSPTTCYTFTSHFLYPPTNIQAAQVTPDDAVYVTWDKPMISDSIFDHSSGSVVAAIASGPAADVSAVQGTGTSSGVPMNNSDAVWDNGTMINSPGTGAGGADESIIEGSNYGSTASTSLGYTVADDFIVPSGAGWDVNKFTFYVYQTNAPLSGSISACFIQVYDAAPNAGGVVIFGDMTTNMMTADVFSNIYRVTGANGGTARAIQKVECALPSTHHFAPGTYWVEYTFTGNSSYSGPYVPYCVGTTPSTPNALQYASSWATLLDGSVPRSLPIEIAYGGISGPTPPGLIGYNVYRDDVFRYFVNSPDTLHYYDFHVDPGTYCYDVTAKYDLTAYGFPGQFDESLVAMNGPACVDVIYGRQLPFFEPWTNGTFTNNAWVTDGGNWSVNAGVGTPAPSADFSWQPIVHNYTQTITTPTISAAAWTCADLWLDFDVKLIDRNQTGDEKLLVEIYKDGAWSTKAEFENSGSIDWTAQHLDIKNLQGKAFKIRFNATGVNSDDIIHWYVDNINVYGICKAPTLVSPTNITQSHFTTTLTWTPPVCSVPTQIIKLFQWSGTPDNAYYQQYAYGYGVVYDLTSYPDATLNHLDFHHSSWGTMGTWQYKIHVVDWDSYTEVATLGPLTTTGNDIWENGILLGNIQGLGGHNVGIMMEPMSNNPTDAFPDFSGDNIGPDGVSLMGALPNYAAFSTVIVGDFLQNLWVEVPLEDGMVTFVPDKVKVSQLQNAATRIAPSITTSPEYLITNQTASVESSPADSTTLLGYNVYRTDSTGTGPYTVINPSVLTAATYVDNYDTTLESGEFRYFVMALFEDSQGQYPNPMCQSSSDTVLVTFPAVGVNDKNANSISLYPNPATDYINVVATSNIKSVEIMNFLGQSVYTTSDVKGMTMKLNVQGIQTGIYFVKVTAEKGTKTMKITITH